MRNRAFGILCLGFVFICLTGAASQEDGRSFVEKAGDWWAVLGKTPEEKEVILEERQAAAGEAPAEKLKEEAGALKEKVGAKIDGAKDKIKEGVAKTKEGVGEKAAVLKEQAQEKISTSKEKVGAEWQACQQRLKEEGDKAVKGTKSFLEEMLK